MKTGEVKIRLSNSVMNLIDTYFSGSSLNEKFVNSTLKIILKQNLYKVDSFLNLFSDQNGEINVEEVVNEYSKMIDENGIIFDLKKYVNDDMVKMLIPDKVLIIKREDILNLFN